MSMAKLIKIYWFVRLQTNFIQSNGPNWNATKGNVFRSWNCVKESSFVHMKHLKLIFTFQNKQEHGSSYTTKNWTHHKSTNGSLVWAFWMQNKHKTRCDKVPPKTHLFSILCIFHFHRNEFLCKINNNNLLLN